MANSSTSEPRITSYNVCYTKLLRFKAEAVYYVAPTEDNRYQTEKMKDHGIFSAVKEDVGEIIVADVNQQRIAELLAPDRIALQKLIRKED